MTFSSRPAVVADIFDNSQSTYFGQPTSDEEIDHTLIDNYPSKVSPCSRIDHVNTPIYSARVTTKDGIQAQHFASQDFRNDPALSLPGYTNQGPPVGSMADSTGSVTSLADEYPLSYQAAEMTFQAPFGLSGAPHSFDECALAHSQVIQDPLHIDAAQSRTTPPYSTSSVVQPRDHPAIHSGYQESSPFEGFAGNVTVVLSLIPVSTVNEVSVTTPSNTIHICRCSSACNAVLNGSIRAVRSHLKQEHEFRGAAKESIRCLWKGCERILQRENIPRHIITRHLRVKVTCPACGIALSRRDVQYSHARVCRAKGQASSSQLRTNVSSAIARSMFNHPQRIQPFLTETMSLRRHGDVPRFSTHPSYSTRHSNGSRLDLTYDTDHC